MQSIAAGHGAPETKTEDGAYPSAMGLSNPGSTLWELDAATTALGTRRQYIQVAGGLVAGSLLSQIVYWSRPAKNGKSKLKVFCKGVYWIAKTREEWCEECCISLKQYKRAIMVLKARGFVVTRIMKFAGTPMTHVHLNIGEVAAKLSELHGAKTAKQSVQNGPSKWDERVHPVGPNQPIQFGQNGPRFNTEITYKDYKQKLRTCFGVISDPAKSANEKHQPEKHQGGVVEMKAEEVLKNRKKAKKAMYGDSGSKKPLATLWLSLCAEVIGKFQAPLTVKERGQLKKFEKDVGSRAADVMKWAVKNWWKFGVEVKATAGLENWPVHPSLAFLLKHRTQATNMFLQSIAQPAPTPIKPVEKPEKPWSAYEYLHSGEASYKPTPEEIAATMAMFRQG